MKKILEKIIKLQELNTEMYGKDFLLTWEKSLEEIESTVLTAEILKLMHDNNISARIFETGLAVSNFRDNSTRTRFSFASAANLLGLAVQDLEESKSQIAHGETVRETANMISFLTEVIGIRDDMYPGLGDSYQREIITAVHYGYNNGILAKQPVVVNLQSDLDHPTQTLADLAKMIDYFGGIESLKNKKMAVTWAYSPSYGKPLSVPQGLIGLMSRLGMQISLAYPEGYELLPEIEEMAAKNAEESGGSFEICHDMAQAFAGADIVYPKSWAPLQIMRTRTELMQQKDFDGLDELEKKCLLQNAQHTNWECDQQKMALTREGEALYMHCLPADITGVSCVKGEVSAKVFEKYMVDTYQQAGYKPYVIAAMILLAKTQQPAATLKALQQNGNLRQKY
ncbi:MAG: knotted carbamoyltransferase YgeW [Candidatus Cloacimonetes bacterium]|nr:knotted carbamoyltransferase YgeW [Candidatus Cloacimonadota bacterium]